jgi:imidazolonepropionase-like amidohydrolase
MTRFGVFAVAVLLGSAAPAQVPTSELARPPASARHFTILSVAGPHGESWMWTTPDGTRISRESLNLRGQVFELDAAGIPGADGMPSRLAVRGVTPSGDAAETFAIENGQASWKSPVDAGSATYASPRFYVPFGGPIDVQAWLIERLLVAPNQTLDLLPGGQARAEKLTTLEVGQGAARQTITAWAVSGLGNSPQVLWTDAVGRFFGLYNFLAWLPTGYESALSAMEKAQNDALATRVAGLSKQLARTPAGAVAFTNVQTYDAIQRRFVPDQTVVVLKDRIAAVGPSRTAKIPPGAEQIDGRGRTLVPGLWDAHMHVTNDFTGLQELSLGVTSIRDPGNSDAATIDRVKRRAAGTLLFPHVYASSLIDGKGPYTAQVANVATSEAETVTLVRKAKANGFIGVKFYGTLDPKWLPAAIAEAKKLGLHVHGHIPAGIRPLDAVNAGYDEITHINWVVMQAMPDDVIKVSNGIARFEGPGRHARRTDIEDPRLRALVQAMGTKRIAADPTMVTFEGLYVPEMGDLSGAYAPFVGTLPPALERSFRTGGFAVPKDLTRADYRASFAMMKTLLAAMHRSKVPIVAGTDGYGIEIVRELEIYVEAGLTPAEALATATIEPARLVKAQDRTGSIEVGKIADLVLIEGDPSKRIGDLRHTRVVVMDGRLMDADALRKAAGFSGRPKK